MFIKESQIKEINQLCNDYNVEKMYVFGSVLTSKFNNKSDVDFLVKFKPFDLKFYFINYMNLKEKLEKLLLRNVDLVEEQTIKNPFLKKSIDKSKKMIYG
jgi:uncharacterized protein